MPDRLRGAWVGYASGGPAKADQKRKWPGPRRQSHPGPYLRKPRIAAGRKEGRTTAWCRSKRFLTVAGGKVDLEDATCRRGQVPRLVWPASSLAGQALWTAGAGRTGTRSPLR